MFDVLVYLYENYWRPDACPDPRQLTRKLVAVGFESEEIADFAGLNQRSPLYAGVMSVCLFSLAGIPPLVGFHAKLSVLQALIATGSQLHLILAIFAVIMSLIGAFYYLRVIVYLFMRDPAEPPVEVATPPLLRAGLVVAALGTVALGLAPTPLVDAVVRAIAP